MEQQTVNKTRRQATGRVTSIPGLKSLVVEVARRYQHPVYHKFVTRRTKYMVHDEAGAAGLGDTVEIEECRPMSARKRWRVVKTLEKARGVA
jgi:small subunit ribosomal protein S17